MDEPRKITLSIELEESNGFYLSQGWVTATLGDGRELDVACGAGLGGDFVLYRFESKQYVGRISSTFNAFFDAIDTPDAPDKHDAMIADILQSVELAGGKTVRDTVEDYIVNHYGVD